MSPGLLSWGNYPPVPQVPLTCQWRDKLYEQLTRAHQTQGTTLPYGAGMSYGDSCLAASGYVLYMRPLDRFIAVDWATGLLLAEAGVTLEEILAISIPAAGLC